MKGSVTRTASLTTLQSDTGMIARAACAACGRESSRPSELLAGAARPGLCDGLLVFSSFPHFHIFKLPLVDKKKLLGRSRKSLAYKDQGLILSYG